VFDVLDKKEDKDMPVVKDKPQAKAAQNIRRIIRKNMEEKGLTFADLFPEKKNKEEK
jgi:hypothetical protein